MEITFKGNTEEEIRMQMRMYLETEEKLTPPSIEDMILGLSKIEAMRSSNDPEHKKIVSMYDLVKSLKDIKSDIPQEKRDIFAKIIENKIFENLKLAMCKKDLPSLDNVLSDLKQEYYSLHASQELDSSKTKRIEEAFQNLTAALEELNKN